MSTPATPPPKPVILAVDDAPDNLALLHALLKERYTVKVATQGEKALRIAQGSPPPDLILLDVMMPGMDGYTVMERLQSQTATRSIPVIFLTARTQLEDEERGLSLGAVDFITKPLSPTILNARIQMHLTLKLARDILQEENTALENEVGRRTQELSVIQDVTILAMASLAETRDNETGNHIRRTQNYVKVLARKLQQDPRFQVHLDDRTIELLYKSAPMHDIGKVGIPDHILLKPGKLSDAEFEVMKSHTTLGRDAIATAERLLDNPNSFLRHAREIAYSHQEKWDGSGYPQGLQGEEIPLSARLMAIADVYDALISRRVYKPPFSHEEAVGIISRGRGSHFDPDMVDAFLQIAQEFQAIAQRFADHPVDDHPGQP